jgi:hypothetical protein
MTQTFDAFAVGDTVYIPKVKAEEIEVPCPDCGDGGTWTITTASGMSRTIPCPRCAAGSGYAWMKPKRYDRKLVIDEITIRKVKITTGYPHKSEEIETSISYSATAHGHGYRADEVYRTREEAEAAGAVLLAEDAKRCDERWLAELTKHEERSGQDIVRVLQAHARERAEALESKIEKLKEKMLDAVKYPSLYGPKLTRPWSGAAEELTATSLAAWLNNLLEAAEIGCWSEEELHEATCHC